MNKIVFLPLFALITLNSNAAPITWQSSPPLDLSASLSLYNSSQQQMQQSIFQLNSTLQNYASTVEANRREREIYELTIQKIQAQGGQVSRDGNKIYITDEDGTQIFCYKYISTHSCQTVR
ncbi:hypothetical protein GSF12_07865 [Moraxella osloensis]|uniref:Uncharacterized protein n=1 Tax=Faucicola osloensis TaxID=34062 RepID=A0A6P1KCZ9_FAUOS|nr:hypothetical protein [Moraxella osloensis]QHG09808.1 hypothetical protein GSF12_07865 [Moraxella osloensis]